MNRTVCTLTLIAVAFCLAAVAGHSVEPTTATFNSVRGEAQASVSGTFYKSTTLVLTNCVMYSGTTTNTARQGLDAVTVEVRAGTTDSNTAYTATVSDTNGIWGCRLTIPNLPSSYLQVKITDASTNVYIYPWKVLVADQPLQ
jgi:hypothetical protein